MSHRLQTADYRHLFDHIRQQTGLRVKDERFEQAAQLIDRILDKVDMTSIYELLQALSRRPIKDPLWQDIIQGITIGETYFFRNQAHINALRSYVLPELIDRRLESGQKLLRIWSAGCATGEEPYSLAMLLHELIPDIATWHITLLATDINLAYLERARTGLYRPSSFRTETPDYIRQRWFVPAGSEYQLAREIRDMVYFMPLNLAEDNYPAFDNGTMKMDMIVCRNVTIYFDQPDVIAIANRFHEALNPNGWLIVGHSEPMATNYPNFTARNIGNAVFYCKDLAQDTARAFYAPAPVVEQSPAAPPVDMLAARLAESRARKTDTPQSPEAPAPDSAHDAHDLWLKAKAAADREDWVEALAWISQAEQSNKLLPEFHYLRGLVQSLMDDPDAALWSMRQAIYCDPTFVMAHYNLAEIYESMREEKLAVRHWRRAQNLIAGKNPQQLLPFADDLTVEMMQTILAHRLKSFAV